MNRIKKHLSFLGLVLILVLLFVSYPVTATGSQYFASADGLNSDPCAQAAPCSLTQALASAQNGDIVYMESGTYLTEAVLTKSLTLQGGWNGAGTGEVVFNTQLYPTTIDGENSRICILVDSLGINVTIRGLILTHGWAPLGGGGIYVRRGNAVIENNIITANHGNSYGGGIYVNNLEEIKVVEISSNEITENTAKYGGGGITISGETTTARIQKNLLSNNVAVNGTDPGYGAAMQLDAATVLIDSNRIYSNDATSTISCNGQATGNCTLINNFIAAGRAAGDNEATLLSIDNHQTTMKHNTIADGRWGIQCYGSPIINLTNNIFAGLTGQSVWSTTCAGASLSGSHNLFWGNGSDPLTLTDYVSGDPKFLNAASLDFHLGIGSSAIDTAQTDPMIVTDFEGNPRPINGFSDIGADESLIYVFLPLVLR